jgi:hypothetical protein
MDLHKTIKVRHWNGQMDTITQREKSLIDLVQDPCYYNMADIGFHLINEIRRDMGLSLLMEDQLSKNGESYTIE